MARRVMIIALPIDDDDLDIYDVQEKIAEVFPTHEDDSLDCTVYEDANALADDLGWETA